MLSEEIKYADPTLDITFKMLFGQEKHKDILISLLNSLLNFTGEKEIVSIEINNSELAAAGIGRDEISPGIVGAVDILCTNVGHQKIAIEMQGQRTSYFLAREQEYMAKLIMGQVKEGGGKLYHKDVLDTYIVVIGRDNMFAGTTKLRDQNLYELDFEPRCLQTDEPFPTNKMHWKFFELPKFKQSKDFKNITKDSNIKYQWLEFLIECHEKKAAPDRHELIKKGYEIMEVAGWDENTQIAYWKKVRNIQDVLDAQQQEIEAAERKGEIKGKIESDIRIIKHLKRDERDEKTTYPEEKFTKKLKLLKEKFSTISKYYDENQTVFDGSDNEETVMEALGISPSDYMVE